MLFVEIHRGERTFCGYQPPGDVLSRHVVRVRAVASSRPQMLHGGRPVELGRPAGVRAVASSRPQMLHGGRPVELGRPAGVRAVASSPRWVLMWAEG